jgi:hypothetical protein
LELWRTPVMDCIVTDPARLAFIFSRYPETEQGRPGIIVAPGTGSKLKIRNTDEVEELDEVAEQGEMIAAD